MKTTWAGAHGNRNWACLLFVLVVAAAAWPAEIDEVVLKNGRKYMGTIVSDSADSLVLSIEGGTVRIPRDAVRSPPYFGPTMPVEKPPETAPATDAAVIAGNPLPSAKAALVWLRTFEWSAPLEQIPVQVTDRGRWPFLPALAFSAGDFFQLRIFGDPEHPAAIAVSLAEENTEAWEAKGRLLEYMLGVVPGLAVDSRFATLNIRGDSFAVGDLWFAITGAESAETPGRWTVVLMHERSLTPARASLEELETISEPASAAMIDPEKPRSWQKGSWTPEELATLEAARTTAQPRPGSSENVSPNDAQVRQWLALNSTRVYVRSFARVRGRYVPSDVVWLGDQAAR